MASQAKKRCMWKFVAVLVVVVLFFTISFIIGWAARRCQKNSNAAFTSTLHNLLSEIKSENIRNFLRNFTKLPHLSGTEQNLRLARQMQAQWKEFGLDSAELVHYDVLLSYPNTSNPNYISIIDGDGTEIFNTTLSEPIPEGYENVEDIVPPYNAFSAQGEPEGELVYVNYARIEDFIKLKRDLKVNCTGKIAIARYGKIFRGNKVKNAMDAGAIGLILFSDPADYCAPGVDVYPKGWNLPGGGAQRGNVLNLNGAGDPLTPGYPAKEYTYRCAADKGAGLPKIPVHPIGYDDAVQLLRNIGGLESSSDWKGSLNVSYNIGPGFKDNSTDKVRMHIYTNNNVTRIYNVIGKIRGAVEPDRYIILGGHRDSWVFGGIDPTSGAAVLHEVARSAGTLVKKGWRPRRTIIFASWDAEEFGLLGSTEWAEENAKLLQERGVAYVNADSAVEGNYTLRVDCTPLFYNLVYDLAKKIASPDNGYKDKTLYDSWFQKDPWTKYNPSVPKINKLGSGSDFEAYFQRLGLASGRTRYTKNSKTDKYSNYPVYHSVYETFELVEKFYDPTFNQHRAVAQMRAGWVYELADRPVLPFNATDYAKALKSYVEEISNVAKEKQFDVSFDSLFSAVDNFTEAATEFHQRLSKLDTNNPIALRIMNDQMMYLERAFVDPLGLPGRPFYRHIIYAPSSYNKYAGISFPGIYDALFEIESEHDQQKALNEVRRQISVATFAVQAAGETLREVA